jgi:hypothetical protein
VRIENIQAFRAVAAGNGTAAEKKFVRAICGHWSGDPPMEALIWLLSNGYTQIGFKFVESVTALWEEQSQQVRQLLYSALAQTYADSYITYEEWGEAFDTFGDEEMQMLVEFVAYSEGIEHV